MADGVFAGGLSNPERQTRTTHGETLSSSYWKSSSSLALHSAKVWPGSVGEAAQKKGRVLIASTVSDWLMLSRGVIENRIGSCRS